jgi:predicted DNA-binding protein (UPF0251 family)
MAAAKKAASRKAPTTPASASEAERIALLAQSQQIPIKYDPVLVELSKAEAMRRLLVVAEEITGEDGDWISSVANETLAATLEDARAAYVKAVGNKAVGLKPAPAAEAAR